VSAVNALLPSSLDSTALARRLGELVGDERNVQVEFLLHLDEFDRRRAYLEAGFGSLWEYCLRSLHLREGAAGRRIGAMRVLRRFPKLEPALRDGRLCLSTASLVGQVLTDENLEELIERAAFRTKAEVEHLVASVRPREAPTQGIRKVSVSSAAAKEDAVRGGASSPLLLAACATVAPVEVRVPLDDPHAEARPPAAPPAPVRVRPSPAEVRPVAEDCWTVRVTLDAAGKEELEALKALLSHKIPNGDLGAVVREAIRCGIEKYRKGAPAPAQKRSPRTPAVQPDKPHGASTPTALAPAPTRHVPAAVRREVWKRDEGSCAWIGEDGRRCGSRWQLELDHIQPVALGGTSTADNLRIACRPHNMLHAEQVYGREHMDRFRRGGLTIAGDSSSTGGLRDTRRKRATASSRTGARPSSPCACRP